MKNICFIGFGLFTIGGCQRITVSLCNNLCDSYNTHILSLCEIIDPKTYDVDDRVHVHSFHMPVEMRARKSISAAFKLKNFLQKQKIDILFIAGTLPIPLVYLVKPFIKTKIVFCDHENIRNRDKKSLLFRKVACKICDKVVVLTKQTEEDYQKNFNVDKNKIECIYNYIDDCIYNQSSQCNLFSPQIISVGRISSEKGFDLAVDAAKIVCEKHQDWQWHVYGDGPDYQQIKRKIEKNHLENFLILKGMTHSIQEKYKDYSIFVLPSYREGLPLVMLEAKCNQLPIVSFDCPTGPAEIVDNEMNGYLIDCYDTKQMAEKICLLIEDQEKRKSFSKHSKDNLHLFTKAEVMKKWVTLIEQL